METDEQALRTVVAYHDETKHSFRGFARSLGYLDWATQPRPFRRYRGAQPVVLPRQVDGTARPSVRYEDLFRPGGVPPAPVTLEAVGDLLRYSLGLSAWKQFGSERWALRVNPSSGNLHPTEGYVVGGPFAGGPDRPGVFHYASDAHVLETRCLFSMADWERFAGTFAGGVVLAGLTSIHWREAWKYGERAFRYCQHDAGHALAALSISAALLGWRTRVLWGWSDEMIERLLGLDRAGDYGDAEQEAPDCVAVIGPSAGAKGSLPDEPRDLVEAIVAGRWTGVASRASSSRIEWPIIDQVGAATRRRPVSSPGARPGTTSLAGSFKMESGRNSGAMPDPAPDARRLILQRRSAQAFDPSATCSLETFLSLIAATMPAPAPPWDALWWAPAVHLVIFVHRVGDLAPGLYLLVRRAEVRDDLRAETRTEFAWTRPAGIPSDLDLYLLAEGDFRRLAATVSCTQVIAGDSYFSLGMLAEFEEPLGRHGACFYRNLFWEAGVIGQVLYLEAEAWGSRGTGIGCYFDDAVHDVLGLRGHRFQSLYHFTVGSPREDTRLVTLPGYDWERG